MPSVILVHEGRITNYLVGDRSSFVDRSSGDRSSTDEHSLGDRPFTGNCSFTDRPFFGDCSSGNRSSTGDCSGDCSYDGDRVLLSDRSHSGDRPGDRFPANTSFGDCGVKHSSKDTWERIINPFRTGKGRQGLSQSIPSWLSVTMSSLPQGGLNMEDSQIQLAQITPPGAPSQPASWRPQKKTLEEHDRDRTEKYCLHTQQWNRLPSTTTLIS